MRLNTQDLGHPPTSGGCKQSPIFQVDGMLRSGSSLFLQQVNPRILAGHMDSQNWFHHADSLAFECCMVLEWEQSKVWVGYCNFKGKEHVSLPHFFYFSAEYNETSWIMVTRTTPEQSNQSKSLGLGHCKAAILALNWLNLHFNIVWC